MAHVTCSTRFCLVSETSLRFCVAQRDFLVGATIIDNIIRAINGSRKVVLLITPNFLQSGWCKEELLIAHNVSHLHIIW